MAFPQFVQKGQVPVCCNLCESEVKILWRCIDCDLLMCNGCKDRIHPKIRNAMNHKVVDIKEAGPQTEEADFSHIPCKDHKGQICVIFCKSCDQLVCPQCITKIHNGHGLVEISEGYQIQMNKLTEGQNQVKKDVDTLTKTEYKIKEIKNAENAKYMEARNKIQDHNTSLKKSVDQYTEKLLSELDQKWGSLTNSFEKEESRVVLLKKDKVDKNNLVNDILNSNDAETIFNDNKELEKSMKQPLEPSNLDFNSMPVFLPGKISQYNVGSLQHTSTDITLQVIKEYTTDISEVFFMSPCVDSLWISNNDVVQKVQPEVNNLKVISNFDTKINDMAVTPSNDLLLAPKTGSVLKQISISKNKLTDTNYRVEGLGLTTVHVTSDYTVIVGVMDFGKDFPVTGRRAVIIMDKEGKHKTIYEYDRNNQPIFTHVRRITSTNNGNICVVDQLSSDDTGRVVMLGQDGDIINIYTGHPDVNTKDNPFKPVSVATTLSDSIIVTNLNTMVLHILDNEGNMITHIKTRNIGIKHPYSVAFTTTGKVYIGCTKAKSSTDKAKLYEVKLLGC